MQKLNLDNKKVKNEIVELVLRQTDYSKEDAILKLEINNYNFHKVIKEYMTPERNQEDRNDQKKINVNQQIFKEIRNMMDSGERKKRFADELKSRLNREE
jgi:hypothetical protein